MEASQYTTNLSHPSSKTNTIAEVNYPSTLGNSSQIF